MNEQKIDPLKRVFVFNGNQFHTADGVYYKRDSREGPIRRQVPKVRGKKARHEDKVLRRILKRIDRVEK